jgi:hypothetical protein
LRRGECADYFRVVTLLLLKEKETEDEVFRYGE